MMIRIVGPVRSRPLAFPAAATLTALGPLSHYHDNGLEVFLEAVKDGRAVITRGWTKVMCVFGMEQGILWAFRFFNTIGSQNNLHFSLHRYRL
jgi:hypothetical protein